MSFLVKIAEAVGLKKAFSKEVAAPVSEVQCPAHPLKWSDDRVLRKLAADSRDGKTHWILASDMAEFFTKLDAFNEGRDPKSKVYIRVSGTAENYLNAVIDKGGHLAPPDTPEGRALPFDILRDIGPQSIGEENLLIQQGIKSARAFYHADPLNTNLNIETPNGWVKFEFGMDYLSATSPQHELAQSLKLK